MDWQNTIPKELVIAVVTLAKAVAQQPAQFRNPPRAYLVGGAVRDALRGQTTADVDVEVFGVSRDALRDLLAATFAQKVEVTGESFGVFRVRIGEHVLDVSIPRRDRQVGPGHKDVSVEGDPELPLVEAARRRDFTINAIMFDPLINELHDPFGGAKDLEIGVLRVVDQATFQEDPLRIWRAVQLVGRFELTMDPDTERLLSQMVARGDLAHLPKERITAEFRKLLLLAHRPSFGCELAKRIGIIAQYPEWAALEPTPQEPEWHPEGNVWIHTNMVLDEAAKLRERDPLHITLGAFLHDFGKPLATKQIDGRWRALGHCEAAEVPIRSFLSSFTFGTDALEASVILAREHLSSPHLWDAFRKGNLDEAALLRALRRLLKRLGSVPWETLRAVMIADQRGRGFVDEERLRGIEACTRLIAEHDLEQHAKTPLLTGQEILDATGLMPGPRVGEIMDAIEAARDEGQVETKEQALAFAKQWLSA